MNKLLPIAFASLIGCGQAVTVDPMETTKDEPTINAVKYPSGPYGYSQGSVVADLELTGQHDTNGNGLIDPADTIAPIHFADYYGGKTKVLVVMVAAGWCGPCKMEQPGLVQLWNAYQSSNPGEVAFLEAIIQNPAGQPSDMVFVDQWAKTYQIPFDMAADPTVALGPYYNIAAFPMQMVLQTKDMTIQWQNNGLANEELKAQVDSVLAAN